MEMKRQPILKKIRSIVLLISIIALLLTSAVGLLSMLMIKSESERALTDQMELNLNNIVSSKADLAHSELSRYSGYISEFADYANWLYAHPESFVGKPVLPPDAQNAGTFSMQRYLTSDKISLDQIESELALLGNLEQIWHPVISANSEMITTIYVGTESGFLISYDLNADLGVTEGSYESYFNYFRSSWYVSAKYAKDVFFTSMYPDSYGRGLTISCVSPFFDADGNFAGAVAMDILITDLHKAITDIDLGEGAYAFLIDRNADIIESPYVTLDQTEFENIRDESHSAHDIWSDIMGGKTGVSLAEDSVYYAYTPISGTDWKLCIHIPESLILMPVERMNQDVAAVFVIFLVVFVLIIAVVFFTVRRFTARLTKPLIALGDDVKTISSGDLDYRAKIYSNDEIGDLAVRFNNMAASLKTYISDLTSITAEKERIGAELDIAKHIQASMLPCIFPAFPEKPEFDIYATMDPAKEVGGDFYDFFMVDDRHLAIVMADVSGKGVPAALFMVIGKTLIKDHTTPDRDLGKVFTEVNNLLCEANSEGLFITAFEGVLDLVTGEFKYVNAGHEMPFICKAGGEFAPYKIRAAFVLAGMEDMRYRAGSMMLEPGDKVFQYTDGVTEATNSSNELYGMDRLGTILNKVKEGTPHEILPAVKKDIDEFVAEAPQFDDITMLCLEYKVRMEEKEDAQ